MPLYATLQEFRNWSGDQSAELSQRDLERASRLVTLATAGAVYDVDGQQLPTDTAVKAALQSATFEVLAERARLTEAGELAGLEEATIGSVRFKLATGAGLVQEQSGAYLPLEAHRVLAEAGLVGGAAVVYG